MRSFLLKYTLFVFCSILVQNSYSQVNDEFYEINKSHILDGGYIKETSITRKVIFNARWAYWNSFIAMHYGNYDSISLISADDFARHKLKYSKEAPIEINDCVYFNPLESFQRIRQNPQVFSVNAINKKQEKESYSFPANLVPNSIRFNIKIEDLEIIPKQEVLLIDSNPVSNFNEYLRPFYFRKFEVTNGEYREFVNWVKDSIMKTELIKKGYGDYGRMVLENIDTCYEINRKSKIDFKNRNIVNTLDKFYIEGDRFYGIKDVNSEILIYNNNGQLVPIYPDTLSWVKDFTYSYNEPMTNGYFWHPYYNDNPVVGVTFHQASAFLKWKTIQHQKELDEKGINFKVKYELPTDLEWDMAATSSVGENGMEIYKDYYSKISDESWVTNLNLWRKDRVRIDSINEEGYSFESYITDPVDRLLSVNNNLLGVKDSDGSLFTIKSNIDLLTKSERKTIKPYMAKDELGICFMGGNVSEWLQDSYKDQWKPIFEMRQKQLATFDTEEQHLIAAIEQYYDKRNDTNGVLVRGANWFDERYSNTFGRNIEGVNAKVFVNPDSAHCTLGFRYVIHIEPK